jgi:hypothetical protein
MSFVLGSVLFLLGGFLGMITMALSVSVRDSLENEKQTTLRIVNDNE